MIVLGTHRVDVASGVVHTPEGVVTLSEMERELLEQLARQRGQLVPRATLEAALWPGGLSAGSRALDLLLSRLRARVEPARERGNYLQSVRGQGFVLVPPAADLHPANRRGVLVGRTRELVRVLTWARGAKGRWLTVTGLGGIGKTRIAGAVADTLTAEGRPVRWVDLAPLADGDAPLFAVATALGIALGAAADLESSLRLYRDPVTLFLDNLEHVPGATARLVTALALAPCVRVIATSRQLAGAPGEQVVRLDGIGADAPVLFRELLGSVVPDLVGKVDDAVIDEICTHVAGMPLSIELAVATLRFRPPAHLLATLRDRPHVLSGERHGRPYRQASLEATFAYSWALLEPDARAALSALSYFAGRFSEEEALGAVGVERRWLDVLAARSLVRDAVSAGGDRALHPLVRSYAAARRGEGDPSVAARYRRWFLAWAGAQRDAIRSEADPRLVALWTRRMPDLGAAWFQAVEARDAEALRIGWRGIGEWIEAERTFPEASVWCRAALDALKGLTEARPLRADILAVEAPLRVTTEDVAAAARELEAELADDPPAAQQARLLTAAGDVAAHRAEFSLSDGYFERALRVARGLADDDLAGRAWMGKLRRYVALGRSDLGLDEAGEAVRAFRRAGNQPLLRRSLLRLAGLRNTRQDDEATNLLVAEVLESAARAQDDAAGVTAREIRMRQLRRLGRTAEALGISEEVAAHYRRCGSARCLEAVFQFRSTVLLDLGRVEEAEREGLAAVALNRTTGTVKELATTLHGLATIQMAAGRLVEAKSTLGELRACVDAQLRGDAFWQALCAGNFAFLLWHTGELPTARREADHALAVCGSLPPSMRFAIALIDAILLAEAGERARAADATLRALDIAATIGEWMVQRALIHVGVVLSLCGHAPLAAALLPQLRAAEPTPEKWIYLPRYEARMAGVTPEDPPIATRADAVARARAALGG